jgi:hypothetical protein
MKKILEFLLSLFFSKEAIALVRQEAVYEGKTALTQYENKKYLSKFKKGSKYKKASAH